MSHTLTIGQLAKATSVAARTIRYYEQVGVLPPAARKPSGYRTYDQRAVERLLFIRRARALGLPLRDLEALSATLEGRSRGGVRPRLLALVRGQLSDVEHRMVELKRLRQQLTRVAERLLASPAPRPGAGCRCLEVEDASRT